MRLKVGTYKPLGINFHIRRNNGLVSGISVGRGYVYDPSLRAPEVKWIFSIGWNCTEGSMPQIWVAK